MGFTYINTLTGSLGADNKPAIKMDIPVGNDGSAAGTKYFELQRYENTVFYVTKEGSVFASQFTGSSGRIQNNLVVKGSLELNNPITGSNSMFISGAGSPIAGYVGIMIGGVKYKMPLYPWT